MPTEHTTVRGRPAARALRRSWLAALVLGPLMLAGLSPVTALADARDVVRAGRRRASAVWPTVRTPLRLGTGGALDEGFALAVPRALRPRGPRPRLDFDATEASPAPAMPRRAAARRAADAERGLPPPSAVTDVRRVDTRDRMTVTARSNVRAMVTDVRRVDTRDRGTPDDVEIRASNESPRPDTTTAPLHEAETSEPAGSDTGEPPASASRSASGVEASEAASTGGGDVLGADPAVATDDTALSLPPGRALAALSATECHELLTAHGVLFAVLSPRDAPGVSAPVRVGSPLGDVDVVPAFASRNSAHAIMDCRLALAIVAWAPWLRARGVVRIEHYSAFRPGSRVAGSGAPSGHASALALDVARLVREDGALADVREHWGDRTRGADPCAPRSTEPEPAALLRGAVCAAVAADLFQVVITPHHDLQHQNHVHVELRPGVDWTYVR